MNRILLPACAALLLSGCGGGSDSGTGTLNLSVTDAPVDNADAVVVTFTSVSLQRSGETPIEIVFDDPVQIDLLELQGDRSEFLIQNVELPAGVYDDVRLRVAGEGNSACNAPSPPYDSYITIDGSDFPLIVPSGGSSGYKLKGGITIAAGGTGDYTVDFDLRKSIAERGATGCYNLKPVLRVVDNAVVGTLTGSVDAALLADTSCAEVAEGDTATGAGSAVYVYEGAVTPDDFDGVPAGTVGDTGPDPLTTANLTPVVVSGVVTGFTYQVGFLLADRPYTVAFTCQAGNDAPPEGDTGVLGDPVSDNTLVFVQPRTVTVTEAGPNVANFTVTAPAAP